jgi:glucose-6-phosphate 1-dehydrogenase
MSTALGPGERTGTTDEALPADVFVVFGITGDLAKVMTFHSLYRLEHRGDSRRFTRQDALEQAWRVLQQLLDARNTVQSDAQCSWGPQAADDLVTGHGKWHDPWVGS